ncbi:F-box protein At3g58530-like [Vicia villosa]|uniref:F-box protein At3g58530-like n=1 Tax=Vicia villosa TaxID=3911 RepID=UPI00273AFDF6|nr:F-box protein At3g58530-like [Vicia villosa]
MATALKTVALTIKLELPDFVNLFSVSRRVYNAFLSALPLWQTLVLSEVNNAGDRLLSALSLTRFHNVKHIYLASAQGIEDKHLKLLKTEKNAVGSLENLESLNLDCCGNISNRGVQDVLSTCPKLKNFSIRNNFRVTDFFVKSLVKNCKCLTDLNLSGCKNITDNSLLTIRNARLGLESLDIAGCERVTDAGVIAIAEGCRSLKFLSLSGIPGVTNKCLETLSELCSNTLTTLDVDGCSGIEIGSREQLLQLFPNLEGGLP